MKKKMVEFIIIEKDVTSTVFLILVLFTIDIFHKKSHGEPKKNSCLENVSFFGRFSPKSIKLIILSSKLNALSTFKKCLL